MSSQEKLQADLKASKNEIRKLKRLLSESQKKLESLTIQNDRLSIECQDLNDRLQDAVVRRQMEDERRQAQKMEALGMMAGGIAHDFNNILAIILACTEQARHLVRPGDAAQPLLWEIIRVGLRAKELIAKLLSFGRLHEREFRDIDINQMIIDTVEMLRPFFPANIRIECTLDELPWLVRGDKVELQQLMLNIFINAEGAMAGLGGLLSIQTGVDLIMSEEQFDNGSLAPGQYVYMCISDTGHGMDKETMDQIFDPFFTTRIDSGNSGLGLSVVQGIVRSHGGMIKVTSQPNQGSSFKVYLPVAGLVKEGVEGIDIEPALGESYSGHILFVDDEAFLTSVTTRIFERLGFTVTSCTDPRQALDIFAGQPEEFDLVITDQTMPDMLGVEMIKEMRRIRPDLPAILCTGYSQDLTYERVKDMKIDHILQKPVLSADYERAIQAVLNARAMNYLFEPAEYLGGYSPPGWTGPRQPSLLSYNSVASAASGLDDDTGLEVADRINILEAVITGMAHEIRQALSAIAMASSEALYWHEKGVQSSMDELIEDMGNIRRSTQKIDELLHYATHFVYREAAEDGILELNSEISQVLKLMASRMMAHGIKLQYTFDPNPIYIRGAAYRLEDATIVICNDLSALADTKSQGLRLCFKTQANSDQNMIFELSAEDITYDEIKRVCMKSAIIGGGLTEYNISQVDENYVVTVKFNMAVNGRDEDLTVM